jgi:hypothetical protein
MVLLWASAIGLLAYAIWQILMIINGYTWVEKGKQRFLRKFGAGSRAFVAGALGIYTIEPFGPWLVGIVALVIIGVGVAAIRRGVMKKFMEDLNSAQLPKIAKPLGIVGYSAKGVAYSIIGILVGIAAINAEPGQAKGLDGALKTLQEQTFGSVLLFLVGLGFAAYGVFCFAAAKAHKG